MSWQTELTTILRVLVNDLSSTSYTDSVLQKTLAVAARQVSIEMEFTQDFVITIGADSVDITPDPTSNSPNTRDDSFNNLVTIKAACIIDQGSAILAAKQAIAIGDGSSKIDLRSRMQGQLALLEKGWCSVYERAKDDYQLGSGSIAGAVVMTPFRLFAQFSGSPWGWGAEGDRWGRPSSFY